MKAVWTRHALRGLISARDHIAEDNPGAASRAVERIEEAARVLRGLPEIGRPGRVEGARELSTAGTPFIVVYIVGANCYH